MKHVGFGKKKIIFLVKSNRVTVDGISGHYFNPKRYSLISKWTGFCVALDFHNNTWDMRINGKENTGKKTWARPTDGFMSNNTDLPMVIRIGHYYFDNKPIIGRIVDINIWSR